MTSTIAFTTTIASNTWNINPAHSSVEFKVRHMMILYMRGQLPGLSGVLKLNEADYIQSTVEAAKRNLNRRLSSTDHSTVCFPRMDTPLRRAGKGCISSLSTTTGFPIAFT